MQKVLSLIGLLSFIPGISQVYFKMLHCTWMVCWIANDTRLFCANCFPTDRVIPNWNIHWPVYSLHWNMDQKTEIRSYIKCHIRLNIDSKQIFNEFCGIYGPQTISMRTVFRWVKALKAGKFSVEDDTRPRRPKTSVTRRSRVQPPPRSATFFRGDWSWNIFYGHSLPSTDSRRAVVSFWWKNVHNTG